MPARFKLSPVTRSPQYLLVLLTTFILVFGTAPDDSKAQQLSVQRVVGNAVEEVDAKHQDVQDAITVLMGGNVDGARKLLESAREKDPRLPPIDVMLALMCFDLKRPDIARAAIERAIKEEPNDPEPYIMLADLSLRQRRLTDAEVMFSKGSGLAEQFKQSPFRKKNLQTSAYAGLAAVAEMRQDWPNAVKHLQSWIKIDPKDAGAHVRLGQALFRTDKVKEAIDELQAAHDLNGLLPAPEIGIASLYQQVGKLEEAKSYVDTAIKKYPDDLQTRIGAARWALDAGLLDAANDQVTAAQKIDQDSIEAKLLAGLLARHKGDVKTAKSAFETVLVKDPRNTAAMNQLALVLVEDADERERIRALGYAQLNAQLHPDTRLTAGRQTAVTLAWVCLQLKQEEVAERLLQRIVNRGPISGESAYHAAKIFQARKQDTAARQILEAALKTDAVFPKRAEAEKLLVKLGED